MSKDLIGDQDSDREGEVKDSSVPILIHLHKFVHIQCKIMFVGDNMPMM